MGRATMPEVASGRGLAARVHPEDLVQRQYALAAHLDEGGLFNCEYRLRADAGGFVWVQERGQAERDTWGRTLRMLGIIRAIGDRKAEQSRVERLANYDELTGHYNRTRLREAVDGLIVANQRRPQPAAFLAVGIDRMAAINAAFGREAADTVLIEIGRRLDACLRVSDMIGRLGGDRYGVVLANCPSRHIGSTADKILAAVRLTPIKTDRGSVEATVSIGSASIPARSTTSYDVITHAESALADAKRAGRDCHVHSEAPNAPSRRHAGIVHIGESVRAALRGKRLEFTFQPVVAAATGVVDYYECLLHMREDDGRIIGAGAFVPAVEQLGIIRLVDRYVLDKTLDELASHPDVTLGFNISGLTAADRSWLRALLARLRGRPELARRLVIEITETAALYDIEESVRFVGALQQTGCRVALDDFGVGHASLRHLQSLAVDTVKIDGSFVRGLAHSAENQVFLRHLLGLAKSFGLSTVAEGVETAEDAAILQREGVGFLQGHYYGRPSRARPWQTAPAAIASETAAASPAESV
jgi:diguanylate cyclase (GGDEF)-like protein